MKLVRENLNEYDEQDEYMWSEMEARERAEEQDMEDYFNQQHYVSPEEEKQMAWDDRDAQISDANSELPGDEEIRNEEINNRPADYDYNDANGDDDFNREYPHDYEDENEVNIDFDSEKIGKGFDLGESVAENLNEYIDHLKGGKGDHLHIEDVDQPQVEVGREVEMEHTDNEMVALEIAIDHLAEIPDYYTKLVQAGLVDEEEALQLYNELILNDKGTSIEP